MAKRVGVILAGCGRRDGSDVAEALLTLLILERAGAEAVCVAPDVEQPAVIDHLTGAVVPGARRQARAEAARILPASIGEIAPLSSLDDRTVDALVIPGGEAPAVLLSDYAQKGQVCQVHPDVVRLLRAMLPARRPMGFVGMAGVLAARVLGPVAGVRLTFGPKHVPVSKHAAVMGADVRPAGADDVIVDQKARVFSTPGFLAEGARLAEVARGIDKLVRGVLGMARDRAPRPPAGEPPAPVTTGRDRGSA